MSFNRKVSAAAQRYADRRRREDEAPRLSTEIPDVTSLTLEIRELTNGMGDSQQKYVRKIVVENAPALFLVPCGDPRCMDGGHDITAPIMRALRNRQTTFEGEGDCRGTLGTANCRRVLHFSASAEFRPRPS